MQQLTYIGTRQLEWRDVPEPTLDSDIAAICEPVAVSTCDMDGVVIHGGLRVKDPTPVGHEGVGRILDIGAKVKNVTVGDLVLMPWKVSCGTCRFCVRGHTGQCETVVPEASFSWGPTPSNGGFLSDLVRIPYADAMLQRISDDANPVAVAGVADNITDGWRAVGPGLAERPGGSVLVVGGARPGSIGLYAAGLAVALGASRTVFASAHQDHLDMAAAMGAEPVLLARPGGDGISIDELDLFDLTVDASGDPNSFPKILDRTERAGVCTSTAAIVYAFGDIPIDLRSMYRRSVSINTGWVHTVGQWSEPLDLVASGAFDPSPVLSNLCTFDDVAEALCESFTKVIATR